MELELDMFANKFTPTATAKTKDKPVKKQESEQDKKLHELVLKVREIYINGYQKRYKVSPKIDVRFHSILKRFVMENGDMAQSMMQIFIDSDNPYYIRNYHNEKLIQIDAKKLWAQAQQQSLGIQENEAYPKTHSQKLREVIAGMHHNFSEQDYDEGVDENGRLLPEKKPPVKNYDEGVDKNGRLID